MAPPDMPVAILTGAGSGIGRAAAIMLAREGWRVALIGRRIERLEETGALMRRQRTGAEWIALAVDIGDFAAASGVVDQTVAHFGRLDALINNAAVLVVQALAQADEQSFQQTFAANVYGPAATISRAWPVFTRQRSGRIVNISSVAAIDPFPGLGAYAASKAALESLTRSVVVEGRDLGIEAYSIALGAVETDMLRSVVSAEQLPPSQALRPEQAAELIVSVAMGRRRADIGRTIVLDSP